MSNRLPLEVLGMIGPLLCWVERSDRSGLPANWYGGHYPFKQRMRTWLMRDLPAYSYDNLDEIIQLAKNPRNPYLFPEESLSDKRKKHLSAPPEGFDLVNIFHNLSQHYFHWTGNELCIREDRMVELHELAIRFPVHHFIRYCHADAVARGYISQEHALQLPVQVSQLHTTYKSLRTVVEKGISEGHLHLNGVISANESWADRLLRRFTLESQTGLQTEERKLKILGRIAMQALAFGVLQLLTGDAGDIPFGLIPHMDRFYQANPVGDRGAITDLKEEFNRVFGSFRTQWSESSTQWDQANNWLLLLIKPGLNMHGPKDRRQYQLKDIDNPRGIRSRIELLQRLHFTVHRVLIEFNVRSKRPGTRDSGFPGTSPLVLTLKQEQKRRIREFLHQVFVRYLIYNTHHWQKSTQSGKTTGLRHFQKFYDSGERRLSLDSKIEEQGLAVERLSGLKPLREIEGRVSPPDGTAKRFIPWLVAFANEAREGRLDKFGLVVHFFKIDMDKRGKYRCVKGQPVLRYGGIRRATRSDAFKLFRLLTTPGPVVPFIVGIDAASLELTTPPEVFAPAFRFLREYPIKLRHRSTTKEKFTRKYDKIVSLVKDRRLGMTYHVGEDFRHLLSGLRAIHEVMEFLKPLPGDRLGHAIALALEPEIWATQMGYQAVLSKQEWLDTLVWVHYLLGAGNDLIGLLEVEDRIQRLSKEIYGRRVRGDKKNLKGRDMDELDWLLPSHYDAWRLRQLDPYSLTVESLKQGGRFDIRLGGRGMEHKRWADVQKKVLGEVEHHIGSNAAYDLAKRYWFCSHTRSEGEKIITIDMKEKKDLWLTVCRDVQKAVRHRVREKQLVVEVNPTSNRVIGPMEKMSDHPIFKLTLDKKKKLAREIRVTINTDDPGVFSTSLLHEFYLLGESLLNEGVPETEVVEWLNWLRDNGKDYSFLRDLPGKDDKDMEAILDCLIQRYNPILERMTGKKRKYDHNKFKKQGTSGQKMDSKRFRQLQEDHGQLKTDFEQLAESFEKLKEKLNGGNFETQ